MLTLRVDSSLIPGVNAPITVDALLSAVEPVLGPTGRIVTEVRINDVDEPSFRDPHVLVRVLGDDDTLEMATTPVAAMAEHALDDAVRFLPDLAASARTLAVDLRSSQAAEARPALGNLADNLALLAALVHTADMWARQAGLAATDWLGDDVAAVEQAVGTLEQAAGAGEWGTAASALEGALPEALDAWRVRLTAGRAAVQSLQTAPTA